MALGNVNAKRYGCMPRRYPSPYMGATSCACAQSETTVQPCADMVVAMAYVPWQQLETVYEPENAFGRGTLFPELDKPLMVGGDCCG